MDLIIVAFYTLRDHLLIQINYQDEPWTKMTAACVSRSRVVRWQSTDGTVVTQRTEIYSQYA